MIAKVECLSESLMMDGVERGFVGGGDGRLYTKEKGAKKKCHDSLPDFMKRFYYILRSRGEKIF
jgi:hypothetical protein